MALALGTSVRPAAAPAGPRSIHRELSVACSARSAPPALSEGPGSGSRHYPRELGQQFDLPKKKTVERFNMMSTSECYEQFPLVTHSSVPLHILDREPAGLTAKKSLDAGPATGHRRRPSPFDGSQAHSQVLPVPSPALRRELVLRHTPEVVLQQHAARPASEVACGRKWAQEQEMSNEQQLNFH